MKNLVEQIDYVPENCLLELCFKCNLNCKHCGSSLNGYENARKGRSLTEKEMLNLIDDLKILGGKRLGLVGGEPLLCNCWESIARYASNKGFELSMISNGMLIDDTIAKKIKLSGIELVAISLDGDKEFHNYLRGNAKAYDNVLRAIRALKKHKVQVNVITTIMRDNLNLLPAIEEIIYKNDVSFWQLQIGIPMGKLGGKKELVINPMQLKDVEKFILDIKQRGKVEITVADSIGYCAKNEIAIRNNRSTNGKRIFLGCMAGLKGVAIESNGNVKGCLSLQNDRFIEGNILEESLEKIWNAPDNFKYNRKFKMENLSGGCKVCKYGNICRGGCTSLAYNTSGMVNNNSFCLHLMEEN